MLYTSRLKEILLHRKIISKKNIDLYEEAARKEKLSLEQFMIAKNILSEEKLYRTAADYFKLPFMELKDKVIRKDILFLVPEVIAETHHIIAFDKKDNSLILVADNPDDLQTFEFIGKKTGLAPELAMAMPSAIEETLKQYRLSLSAEFKKITDRPVKEEDKEKLEELAENLPIVRIVDSLLEHAIFEGASDIHIEPSEKEVTVRYRVDGMLRKVMTLPRAVNQGIVARIKILSNLKIDEHRLPQDGRFKIESKEYRFSVRVSILPIFDGEKVVMRLLNETVSALTLEQLGLLPEMLEIVRRNIRRPHGIIFVTGPTGSGKTTTLYSIVSILNKPEVNISTIEDPIEYKIQGVNQSQVNAKIGYTFATGLRSLLRQDPNIIMIGEIRDNETADIAVHAALTGHLVLSTLHTNDAPTSLPRLADMGVPPFLIAFTTNLIIAQRLVRKLCPDCKTKYKLDKKAIDELGKLYDIDDLLASIKQAGYIKAKESIRSMEFYRPAGCAKCGNSGYKGRQGIYEVMEIGKLIKDLIHKKADAIQIGEAARAQHMITLAMDGFIKAIKGITSLEEVMRVTKE